MDGHFLESSGRYHGVAMVRRFGFALLVGWIFFSAATAPAQTQTEFPPPQGKGRVVVVVSGHAGAARYENVTGQIARLGYVTVLFDANDIKGRSGGPLLGFVGGLQVPVLMFAGENDYYAACCLPETARATAAAAASRPFKLVVYPDTKHDFIYGGANYNPVAYADAMRRTKAKLAQFLSGGLGNTVHGE